MNIAISGKMATGKTTIAEYLRDVYGYTILSHAGPFKQLDIIHRTVPKGAWPGAIRGIAGDIAPHAGITKDEMVQVLLEIFHKYPVMQEKNRSLLQDIGNSFRQKFKEDLWVDYLLERASKYDCVVVDDVRYKNEFEKLRASGFTTVRLELPEYIQRERVRGLYPNVTDEHFKHVSEIDLDNRIREFDYIIPTEFDFHITRLLIDEMMIRMEVDRNDATRMDSKGRALREIS